MASIMIRPALESDLDSLCDLYFEFHEFHAWHLPGFLQSLGESSKKERQELAREILKILKDGDAAILVAEEAKRVAGFAEVHLRHPDMNERAKTATLYAHLQSLAITETYRRKKIGTLLLKSTEEWARARGARELRLDTWEFAAGPLEFYQKAGYRTYRRSLVKNI